MFNNYPYTDYHELNTDWIIGKIKNVETAEANTKQYAEDADAAKIAAEDAKDIAVQAKDDAVGAKDDAESAAASVADTRNQIDLLQARVDNIIPDGTQTAGNLELLDIRVAYDGTTYPSAGDAVRGQIEDLKSSIDGFSGGALYRLLNENPTYIIPFAEIIYDERNNNVVVIAERYAATPGKLYTVRIGGIAGGSATNKIRIGFDDSNHTTIQNYNYTETTKIVTLTAPANTAFIRIAFIGTETAIPGGNTKAYMSFNDIEIFEHDTAQYEALNNSIETPLSAHNYLSNEETITPFNTGNYYIKSTFNATYEDNFRLVGNGLKISDPRYRLIKIDLTSRNYDYIKIAIKNVDYYQFQTNTYNVPSSGINSALINTPVAYGDDDVAIPSGAGYLIMSCRKEATNAGMFFNCGNEEQEYIYNGGISKYTGPYANKTLTGNTSLRLVDSTTDASSRFIHLFQGDTVSVDFLASGHKCKIVSFKTNAREYISWPGLSTVPASYTAPEECFVLVFINDSNGIDASTVTETISVKRGYQGNKKEAYDLLPSYWQAYLDTKIPAINADSGKSASGDAFIFFTDYHMKNNAQHTPALVKTIMDQTDIRFVVNGGDVITQETTQANALAVLSAFNKDFDGLNIFNVIGNHDQNNPGTPDQSHQLTNEQAYSMLCKKMEGEYISTDSFDYCFDNKAQKIRYFVIGSWHQSWIVTSQVLWFCNQLLSVPDDYGIFVISHLGLTSSGVHGNFQYILDVMEAYQNRDSNYQYSTSTFDFSNATANVIGAITGHSHIDADYISVYGFPIIGTTTDSIREAHPGTTMTAGTVTEQAFDIVRIDKTNKKISLTRIGAGSDREYSYTT